MEAVTIRKCRKRTGKLPFPAYGFRLIQALLRIGPKRLVIVVRRERCPHSSLRLSSEWGFSPLVAHPKLASS